MSPSSLIFLILLRDLSIRCISVGASVMGRTLWKILHRFIVATKIFKMARPFIASPALAKRA